MFEPDDRELTALLLHARIAEARAAEAHGWAAAQSSLFEREQAHRAETARAECVGFLSGRRMALDMTTDAVIAHIEALRANRGVRN